MSELNFFKKIDKNTALMTVGVIGVIIIGFLFFSNNNGGSFKFSGILGESSDVIGQRAVDYINNNGLSASPASLVNASDESGLVKIRIKIGENEFDSYVTKDSKYLFPQVITMTNDLKSSVSNQPTEEQKQQAAAAIEKTDSPMLEAYVVSRCPYGIQMQRAMAEAVKTIPELDKYFKVRYIGSVSEGKITAMHGDAEAQENFRQICIREEQPSKYWNYIACQMQAGDTAGCEISTEIDSYALSSCISEISRGLAYAKEDFDLNVKYGITGSPTLVLGGENVSEFNFGGRSADAIKLIVCAAFNSQPDFCSAELETSQAAVSFSTTYAGTGTANSAANCAPAQ